MRRKPIRRIVIVGATAGAVLLTGGGAFAFWSSTGTTAGAAEVAADATDLVVTQVGAPSGLFPGGSPVGIVANVENPSGTDIQLTDVTVTVTDVLDGSGASIGAGCPTTDFAIADAAYSGELIPAGGVTADETVATIRLKETGVNQDACKGASVVLSLVAN
jgi:type II secretory pathway pseudopilin PulG